jgi:hypothetical protein
MEGDHAWDEDWVSPGRDDSFNGMVNATWTALDTHVTPSLTQQVCEQMRDARCWDA